MRAAVYFCFLLRPAKTHIYSLAVTKRPRGGLYLPPTMGMAVIVVPVNGTLSYVELPLSEAATAGRSPQDKPSKILATYPFSFATPACLGFFPFITVSRFMPLRRSASRTPPLLRPLPILPRNDSLKPSTNLSSFFIIKKKKKERKGAERGERRKIGERSFSVRLHRDWRGREISPEFHFVPADRIVRARCKTEYSIFFLGFRGRTLRSGSGLSSH